MGLRLDPAARELAQFRATPGVTVLSDMTPEQRNRRDDERRTHFNPVPPTADWLPAWRKTFNL